MIGLAVALRFLSVFSSSSQASMSPGGMNEIMDAIKCPVCLENIRGKIMAGCKSSHSLCEDCMGNLRRCPTCNQDINRNIVNYPLMNIRNKICNFKCRHANCGVISTLDYLENHEQCCVFQPTGEERKCTLCDWKGMNLLDHYLNEHNNYGVVHVNGTSDEIPLVESVNEGPVTTDNVKLEAIVFPGPDWSGRENSCQLQGGKGKIIGWIKPDGTLVGYWESSYNKPNRWASIKSDNGHISYCRIGRDGHHEVKYGSKNFGLNVIVKSDINAVAISILQSGNNYVVKTIRLSGYKDIFSVLLLEEGQNDYSVRLRLQEDNQEKSLDGFNFNRIQVSVGELPEATKKRKIKEVGLLLRKIAYSRALFPMKEVEQKQ